MQLSLLLARQIGVLFVMIFLGFLLVRTKLVRKEDSRIISTITLYVIIPCVVINAFQIDCTPERLHDFLFTLAAAGLAQAIYIAMSALINRRFKLLRSEQASLIYTNCGNLIIPLVTVVFGEDMVFFTSAYLCVQTIMVWTHGRAMISSTKGLDLKKIFLNVNVIATLLGMLLFILNIRLPGILMDACAGMSSTVGPISMLVIGMIIGSSNLKAVFSKKRIYLLCGLRLLVFPAILILLLKWTGLAHLTSSPMVLLICVLAAAAPSATTITQLSQVYASPEDAEAAVSINITSTLLCILTMPLIMEFYQWIIL